MGVWFCLQKGGLRVSDSIVPQSSSIWTPTVEWVQSWKSKLPLQTIMRLLQVLVPQVEKICIDKLVDKSNQKCSNWRQPKYFALLNKLTEEFLFKIIKRHAMLLMYWNLCTVCFFQGSYGRKWNFEILATWNSCGIAPGPASYSHPKISSKRRYHRLV